MMPHLTLSTALLLALCLVTEAARELCFKRAADGVDFMVAMRRKLTWLGIFFWLVEITAWVLVLQSLPLSFAFPLMSIVYVLVVFCGTWILKETVTKRHYAGAVLITMGVACIGATGL